MSCNKYDVVNWPLVVTCEHAAAVVPPLYKKFFHKHKVLLQTHRGYDIGALAVAKKLANKLSAPLFFHTTTRLLVDVNRSLFSSSLFFLPLNTAEQNAILFQYYLPYRHKVEEWVKQHDKVLHLSIHSFTPILDGVERVCDIGLLYDPRRKREQAFCRALAEQLRNTTNFTLRSNYPYKGSSDGFTTYLRKHYPESRYCGIEIEINQKLLSGKNKQLELFYKGFLRLFHDAEFVS